MAHPGGFPKKASVTAGRSPFLGRGNELTVLLESKSRISRKRTIILLNGAAGAIDLWQQSGGDLS